MSNDKKPTILGYEPGPYTRKFSKTIELAPVKFTITESEESSHVPPPEVIPPAPCGCGGGKLDLMSLLGPLMAGFRSSEPPAPADGDPGAAPDGSDAH